MKVICIDNSGMGAKSLQCGKIYEGYITNYGHGNGSEERWIIEGYYGSVFFKWRFKKLFTPLHVNI